MKCAIVSNEQLNRLTDFCNEMEDNLCENYLNEDYEAVAKKMYSYRDILNDIRHLNTAYQTIFTNACDQKSDTLEFRPDLKEFIEKKEMLWNVICKRGENKVSPDETDNTEDVGKLRERVILADLILSEIQNHDENFATWVAYHTAHVGGTLNKRTFEGNEYTMPELKIVYLLLQGKK